MSSVKNIGKPCAGEPHARFDEGGQVGTCSLLYPLISRPLRLQSYRGDNYSDAGGSLTSMRLPRASWSGCAFHPRMDAKNR